MNQSVLFTRRSIRKFNEQPLTDDELNYLLRAAMYAPTSGNYQEWEFVIIRNKETIAKALPLSKSYVPLTTATAVIAVCFDNTKAKNGRPKAIVDGGAASQNILLAATEHHIGGVWLAVDGNPERVEGVREILQLPEHIEPISLIALGHFDGDYPEVNERFDPAKVHYEAF